MEHWKNARIELFQSLKSACDNIEQNLAKELEDDPSTPNGQDGIKSLRVKLKRAEEDVEKHIRESSERQQLLREKESKIQVLSEENSRLETKIRSATRNDGNEEERLDHELHKKLLEEKGSLIKSLTAEKAKLLEESSSHRDVSSRADRLVEENRQIKSELEKCRTKLEKQNKQPSTETKRSAPPKDAGLPNNATLKSPSTSDFRELPSTSGNQRYEDLLKEHLRVKDQWKIQTKRADGLAEKQRASIAKFREWSESSKETNAAFKKKEETIQKQKEEIRKLKSKLQELGGDQPISSGSIIGADPAERILPSIPSDINRVSPPKEDGSRENRKERGVSDSDLEDELDDPKEAECTSPELPKHSLRSQNADSIEQKHLVRVEAHDSSSTDAGPESDNSPEGVDSHNAAVNNARTPDITVCDDVVEVVSARCIRKRKRVEIQTPTPKIKTEPTHSSSPHLTSATFGFSESLDLDAIGEKVATPRKRRRNLQDANNETETTNNEDEMLLDESVAERPLASIPAAFEYQDRGLITPARRSVGTALQPLSPNKRILPRTSDLKPPKKGRSRNAPIRGVEEIIEDGEKITGANDPSSKPSRSHPAAENVLVELMSSPPTNLVVNPYPMTAVITPQPKSVRLPPSRLSNKIADIGNPRFPPRDSRQLASSSLQPPKAIEPKRPESDRKSYVPSRSFVPTEDAPHPSSRVDAATPSSLKRPANAVPKQIQTPILPPKFTNAMGTGSAKQRITQGDRRGLETPNTRKQKLEAYRSLPVEKLNRTHFKINPEKNAGRTDAFHDVVRGKDNRRCLQGCMKPECCGNTFLQLARMTRNPDRPITLAQQAEDEELLEEYLGDNKHKLRNMTKQERQETLNVALAWQMSNKHGKHRQRHVRRSSPPGFWNPDFPSTQEERAEREKADQEERLVVEEMYREAMRPGGMWLFKDE